MFFSISASLQKVLNSFLFADFAPRIKEKYLFNFVYLIFTITLRRKFCRLIYFGVIFMQHELIIVY